MRDGANGRARLNGAGEDRDLLLTEPVWADDGDLLLTEPVWADDAPEVTTTGVDTVHRRDTDPRLLPPAWDADPPRRRVGWLVVANLALAVWYFTWLLQPERIGNPVLYGLLVSVEVFNLFQAAGFWWTAVHDRRRDESPPTRDDPVDVLIPVYDEPLSVVEPTVAAAVRIRGRDVRVALLDDFGRDELADLAGRHGVRYVRRGDNHGAKAGNINHAIGVTDAPFIAVFDCDHVPDPAFLERTLGHFGDERVALVQTPQYYANAPSNAIAGAAWSQQALFFGGIARGKNGLDSMFCCGTNMVLRRAALDDVGGFPEGSVTEDFVLSVRLYERRWTSAYVPTVLANGLGPEDLGSYVSQQLRWARGCLGAIPRVVGSQLPMRLRTQFLLSSLFFLSGWTFLVYISLPFIRMVSGSQPLAAATADQFIAHFLPYYAMALVTVAIVGAGSYSFAAFSLLAATFWVHVRATLAALGRRPARFVVTSKGESGGLQLRAVAPTSIVLLALAGAASYALATDQGPSTLNNVGFAALHIAVLGRGLFPAFSRRWNTRSARQPTDAVHPPPGVVDPRAGDARPDTPTRPLPIPALIASKDDL